MGSNLHELVRITRRWWWLAILVPLIGAGGMYKVASAQQPMYMASAVLRIELDSGSLEPGNIEASIDLAETYRHLVRSASVLSPVIDDLGLPSGHDELRDRLSVSVVRNTQLLNVSASDPNPERAAAIADAVARRFSESIDQPGIDLRAPRAVLRGDPGFRDSIGQPGVDAAAPNPTTANTAAGGGPVALAVPAEVPREPYAPRKTLFALIGAILGLLVVPVIVAPVEYRNKITKPSPDLADQGTGGFTNAAFVDTVEARLGREQPNLQPANHEVTTVRRSADGYRG
jgi:uncharacterized protein involved in exopolysaccharide biosynthesis